MIRYHLLLMFLYYNVHCQHKPCPEVLTVDITNGTKLGGSIKHDEIHYTEHDYYSVNDTIYGCICNIKKPCIRKCCPPNEMMVNKTCVPSNVRTMSIKKHKGVIEVNTPLSHHFVHSMGCDSEMYLLSPHKDETEVFYVQENGSIFLPGFEQMKLRNPEHYCIDMFEDADYTMEGTLSVILCLQNVDVDTEEAAAFNSYGMIISMPFLLATFIVYALLPDRNLHMKALMIYVLSLMMAYLLLVIIQLSPNKFSNEKCTTIGYFCLFFFLISFFWMNVICIDIWLTFSGLRGFSGNKKSAERKRFLMYCAYAFGMPILHISVVKIIDVNASENSLFKPDIGTAQCFLKRGYPELFYFYGPMAIIITINIVLFTITAFKIRSIKKDTSMLKKEDSKRHSYENDKQTFNLYLKLLFAMGVNWSMEIISWAVIWAGKAPEWIWYLTDFCNAIYGVFIFFIFVFKRSIWKLLKKRYYSFTGKAHLAHSMTMTNTTRVTSYSTANSSIHENPHSGANDTSTLTGEA